MSNDDKYLGWANRETWALMLWINNDQGLCDAFRDAARSVPVSEDDRRDAQSFVHETADTYFTRAGYEQEFGDDWPATLSDAASEIGSLWRIDWAEVLVALLED